MTRLAVAMLVAAMAACGSDAGAARDSVARSSAVTMGADPGERHRSCRVEVREPRVARLAVAACSRAASELERLLGRPVPAGSIVQSDATAPSDGGEESRRAGEGWAMEIPTDDAMLEPLELGGGARISAEGYLAHEIAHRMATAMLFPQGESARGSGYGSPLPDWLDEALALLVEPAPDQRARVLLLFEAQIIYALPLRQFLYMPHPALRGARAGSAARRLFYGQSLAFGQFLRARAGDDGVRALLDALLAGETQGVALTTLRGLPADGGALEQEWLAWLRARRDSLRAAA